MNKQLFFILLFLCIGKTEINNAQCTASISGAANNSSYCGSDTLYPSPLITGATYQWQLNGTAIASGSFLIATATGSYTVTIQYPSVSPYNGCTVTSAPVNITINPLPPTNIMPQGSTTICSNASVALCGPNPINPQYIYQWRLNNVNITGATNACYYVTAAGSYTVVVTDFITGCSSITSAVPINTIPIPAAPTVSPSSLNFCQGQGSVLINNATGSYLTWYSSATGPTCIAGYCSSLGVCSPLVTPTQMMVSTATPGTVVFYVSQTVNGCEGPRTPDVVSVLPTPQNVTALSNSPVAIGDSVVLNGSCNALNSISYTWTGPNGFTSSVQNPSILNATTAMSGVYTLTATEKSSPLACSASTTTNVWVTDMVWPGDANYDHTVDNTDILAIGLCYGQQGVARNNASINFTAQPCIDWNIT